MAKTTLKRKSEGETPTTKSKHRKTVVEDVSSRTLEDAEDHDDGEGSDEEVLFVIEGNGKGKAAQKERDPKKKSRKSEPVMSARDEYEEDPGRDGSHNFLAFVSEAVKKKEKASKSKAEFKQKLYKKVNETEDALKERIEELGELSEKQDKAFIDAFMSAYAASRPAIPQPGGPMVFASLFQRSAALTENAHRIVEEFEKANRLTVALDVKRLIDMNGWERENELMGILIAVGHDHGLAKYEAMLTNEEEPEVVATEATYVNALYNDVGEETLGIGWGKVAKAQEKAAKKMEKANSMVHRDIIYFD